VTAIGPACVWGPCRVRRPLPRPLSTRRRRFGSVTGWLSRRHDSKSREQADAASQQWGVSARSHWHVIRGTARIP